MNLCPAGHRSPSPVGTRCGAHTRGQHRNTRCQNRVIVEPSVHRCPICQRGTCLETEIDGLLRPCCSYCGAMGAPAA